MASLKNILLAGVVALAASASAAQAGTYSFTVTTGNTSNLGFQTLPTASPFTGATATASFTYTGALAFNNTAAQNSGNTGDLNSTFFASAGNVSPSYGISGYTGSGNFASANANYTTLAGFVAGSGSAANYAYGSFYKIELGNLAAGTILTILHDDGISVYQGGTQLSAANAGPTTAVTDKVTIGSTGATTLYYSRQNGTPSILTVAVPEPVSLSLLGAGLVGLGLVRRRKARAV